MSSDHRGDRSADRSGQQQTDGQAPGGQQQAGGQPQSGGQQGGRPSMGARLSSWFANVAVRTGLAIIGLVVVIFALGQAVGVDLLGLFGEALASRTGRWLVVAFFGLLIIAAAQHGLAHRS